MNKISIKEDGIVTFMTDDKMTIDALEEMLQSESHEAEADKDYKRAGGLMLALGYLVEGQRGVNDGRA